MTDTLPDVNETRKHEWRGDEFYIDGALFGWVGQWNGGWRARWGGSYSSLTHATAGSAKAALEAGAGVVDHMAAERVRDAAPDLLDACDFALTILKGMGNGNGDAANACRAAIAKALGQ